MDALGKLVHEKRAKKKETRKQLAKVIKCSEHFARHIESSRTVPISDRLITAVAKHYRIPMSQIEPLAAKRARVGRAYMRAWKARQK